MRKYILSFFIFCGFLQTPCLQADPSSTDTPTEHTGEAAQHGVEQAKRVKWQNVALLSGILIVAVATIILVSQHNGHHHK